MRPGELIVLLVAIAFGLIWSACTPPRDQREWPRYWGP